MANSEPAVYTIEVSGHLDPRYAHWFEDMAIRSELRGETPITVLCGQLADQAALYGLLGKLQALNIALLALNSSVPAQAVAPDDEAPPK